MKPKTIMIKRVDGIVIVTLNRPEKLNTVNMQMRTEVLNLLDDLEVDDEVRVVIFTGAGQAFCAGADINTLGENSLKSRKQDARVPNTVRRIYEFEKPIIGAINGISAGDGSQWLLAFDLNVAAENAKIAWPATKLGIL
jgi:enoyl-CoA hydratase/carnithine racemase